MIKNALALKHKDFVQVEAPRFSCLDRFGQDITFGYIWEVGELTCTVIPEAFVTEELSSFIPDAKDLVVVPREFIFLSSKKEIL